MEAILTQAVLAKAVEAAFTTASSEAAKQVWQQFTKFLRDRRFGKRLLAGTPAEIVADLTERAERDPELRQALWEFCFAGLGPNLLPQEPVGFVNRLPEQARLLAELEGARREGRSLTVVPEGPPGVGVSSLVVHFAGKNVDSFPGGLFHVDLTETTLFDALGVWLQLSGVPDKYLGKSRAERLARWRLAMTRPCCLIVDGVTEPGQIEGLHLGAGSMIIAIPRRRPGVAAGNWATVAAIPFPVGPLSDQHSRQVLIAAGDEARLAADPAGTAALLALCGGIPMALRLCGHLLLLRKNWTPSQLVEHLGARHATEVTGFLEEVFATFDESLRAAYSVLSVMPSDGFSAEAFAAAAQLSVLEAEDVLIALADAYLVTDFGQGWYYVGVLVRAHAAQHCADPMAPLRRLVDWFVASAYAADAAMGDRLRVGLLDSGGLVAPAGGAINWFVAQLGNIPEIMRAAAKAGWDDPVWQLAEACHPAVMDLRPYDFWRTITELGLAAALRVGNKAAIVRMYQQSARYAMERGDLDQADRHLSAAAQLAEQIPDRNRSSLQEVTAVLRVRQGRLVEALWLYVQAETAYDPNDPVLRRDRAISLNGTGNVLTQLGYLDSAYTVLTEALDLLAEFGDQRTKVRTLLLRGALPGQAADLEQALAFATELGLTEYRAQALDLLGWADDAAALRARYDIKE